MQATTGEGDTSPTHADLAGDAIGAVLGMKETIVMTSEWCTVQREPGWAPSRWMGNCHCTN